MIGRNSPGVQNGAWEREKRLLSDFGSLPKLYRLISEPVDGQPAGREGRARAAGYKSCHFETRVRNCGQEGAFLCVLRR